MQIWEKEHRHSPNNHSYNQKSQYFFKRGKVHVIPLIYRVLRYLYLMFVALKYRLDNYL